MNRNKQRDLTAGYAMVVIILLTATIYTDVFGLITPSQGGADVLLKVAVIFMLFIVLIALAVKHNTK